MPLYWLILMILTFVVLSVVPMLTGYLLSFLSDGEKGRQLFHQFFPTAIFFFSSLILSILISLALWSKILLPLGAISQAAKLVAKGDFSVRLEPGRSLRELNELTDHFNRMVQELGSIESFQSDFVTNISHEFKTPLAAIEGYATLLQNPSLSRAEQQEYVRIILDSTRQLSSMSGNILLLSRLEKQEIVTGNAFFKLDEQIRQTLLLLEPLWEKKYLDLDLALPSFRYYGNAELLQQVWMNLLQNAIKFTPNGGTLSVSLEQREKQVVVSISDTGIGMDEATQERIFEKFYSKSRSEDQKGNGLGLSITRRIVDLFGGSITVKSKPEEGSCFTVVLPVNQ